MMLCYMVQCTICDKLQNTYLFNPLTAKLACLNFHPLEVVGRYRDPQLQVGENHSYLFNLRLTNLDV